MNTYIVSTNWKYLFFTLLILVVLILVTDQLYCSECVGPFQDPTCSYLKCMEGLCK